MSNFDPNAILRGAQLTAVGAVRAFQNPGLFKAEHYRQAAYAVAAGIVIRLAIAIPIILIKATLAFLSLVIDFEKATWDDAIVSTLDFIGNSVLQLPFFLMSLMRYLTPTLDNLFMDSLKWVDQTYIQKHRSEDPKHLRSMYYPNMVQYSTHGQKSGQNGPHKNPKDAAISFVLRFARRAGISLAIYTLSFLPVVGRFVLPATSFYAFNRAVGIGPALAIFGVGIFLPRKVLVVFLQSYFSSRSLMRELLIPYFLRIRYTPDQKKRWFHDREGLLFGFGVGFYIFLRIPLLGVLIYGIAEASTAYLITKITDPPPPPAESEGFVETQVQWRNKFEFLKLPLLHLDASNISSSEEDENPLISQSVGGFKKDI